MPIDTQHSDYTHHATRWAKVADALGDEDTIKGRGTAYLAKPRGMQLHDPDGTEYEAYKSRARFPEIAHQALTGIVGLVFEQDPIGATDTVITNTGQTNLQLSRDVMRAAAGKGRDILVVDAPHASRGGGRPFVARYAAESMINWKVDPERPNDLTLAVFREDDSAATDIYSHDTIAVYRRYLRLDGGRIEVTRWRAASDTGGTADELIGEPVILPKKRMPIVIAGSIDNTPACDPVPLMPVVFAALAYYRKSATYEQALWLTAQPTPWVKGVDETEYEAIRQQGIGSSVLWHLGNDVAAAAGFLVASPEGIDQLQEALREELRQAESHAVRLTQSGDGVESAASISMRAATQHASIYSIADSVSIAINTAEEMRAEWAGESKPAEAFELRTDFSEAYAGEQMITALNGAVNSGNAPRSAVFEAIRRSGLSKKTDEEMADEIETTGGLAIVPPVTTVVAPEAEDRSDVA